MAPIRDLPTLLHQLEPHLHEDACSFATLPPGHDVRGADVIATMREPEGLSVVVTVAQAHRLGLTVHDRWGWITLHVQSDLGAVGLTAAVATALADAGISCNVIAGMQHDHLFVPWELRKEAMHVLRALQHRSGAPEAHA